MSDTEIRDEIEEELPFKYSIISYGTDFDVEGLVRRVQRGDIYVPPFQRNFIWSLNQASRFIESLLLGLPVPGIFLANDDEKKMLVVDGQQRLRSLAFYLSGIFEPDGSEFRLAGLTSRFEGLSYKELPAEDQRHLLNATIHTTIIRQEIPDDSNSSIYLLFERLNSGGTYLRTQEIRSAMYHGRFNDLLDELNGDIHWRGLFGAEHGRRRDQELILRFFGLYYDYDSYKKPMKAFLNTFMTANRNMSEEKAEEMRKLFKDTVKLVHEEIGLRAFKPKNMFNAAIMDSVMFGIARNQQAGTFDREKFKEQFAALMENEDYLRTVETATTDEENITLRMDLALKAFDSGEGEKKDEKKDEEKKSES